MRGGLVTVLLAWAFAGGHAAADPAKPLLVLHPESGSFDDAWSFDATAARVTVVRSDGGATAEAQVIDLAEGGKIAARVDLTPITTSPRSVATVLDGRKLFVVARAPSDARAVGLLVDGAGKLLRRFGPAAEVTLVERPREPTPLVVTFDSRAGKAGTAIVVAVFELAGGKERVRRELTADAEGTIAELRLTQVAWLEGNTQLLGKKQGEYDANKDRRMNDSEGLYDVLAGKIVRDTVVQDLMEWARVLRLRAEHPHQTTFVHVSEDLQRLELVTADDHRLEVKLDAPLSRYAADSLAQEVGRDGRVYLSLTVDPLNPEAVNRKKRDPELIDFYAVEPGGAARLLLTLAKNDRPFTWHVGPGKIGVLRKHKGGHGGPELEIYEVKP